MKRRCWWFRISLPLLSLPLLWIGVGLSGGGHGNPSLLCCVAGLVALLAMALDDFVGEGFVHLMAAILVPTQWCLIGYGIDRLMESVRRSRYDPGRCPQCGYDIRGLPEPRCPECGGAITLLDPRDNDLGASP